MICVEHEIDTPVFAKRDGFSLMELIVGLALIALAIGLVARVIGTQMPGLELRAEARQIAHILESAQSRALRTRQPVGVSIDLAERAVRSANSERLTIDGNTSITVTSALGGKVEEVARFVFFPDGTTTGGRIALRRKGHEICVEANWLTGHVRTFRKPAKL